MSEVVCIESDDDVTLVSGDINNTNDCIVIEESQEISSKTENGSTEPDPEPGPSTTTSPIKRIKPTLISTEVTSPSKKKVFGDGKGRKSGPGRKVPGKGRDFGSFKRTRIMQLNENALDLYGESDEEEKPVIKADVEESSSAAASEEKITKEFRKLIQTCRSVDSSGDMEKLIRKKLVGYYKEVPHDFTNSKSFRDLVSTVTDEIKKAPHLIYLRIVRIIEELKPRRRSVLVKQAAVNAPENGQAAEESEKNAKKAAQIKKLNKALVQLKKRIDELDQEEVDFEEDLNSAHMKVERYKKRAYQIYEKLCDISGENKHAQRSVRKPIKFHGTVYPEFNKTLQAFVNRTNIFPDYFDVKKCLEHCNKTYDMRLRPEEIKLISQDAFVKVGKILQKRRKIDLYEMISYYVDPEGDPADKDPTLQEKLGQNKQHHSKIGELIDKFAEEQGENGANDDDEEAVSDQEDIKIEPTDLMEINLSILDNLDAPNESIDMFAEVDKDSPDTQGQGANDVDIIESLPIKPDIDTPPQFSSTPTNTGPEAPSTPQEETAPASTNNNTNENQESSNMDDAIQYMVSNSIDPYSISNMSEMLLPDLPLGSTDG